MSITNERILMFWFQPVDDHISEVEAVAGEAHISPVVRVLRNIPFSTSDVHVFVITHASAERKCSLIMIRGSSVGKISTPVI